MSTLKTRRGAPAVNAGSMADIAFLLLIFFLVTTTIAEKKGVLVRLPEWVAEPLERQVDENKVMTVQVNKHNRLMVEGEEVSVAEIPLLLARHLRVGHAPPGERVVSLVHDRATSYARYLDVYDALKLGYRELWDEQSRQRYGMVYEQLSKAQQRAIRQAIPVVISEAEPTEA